MTGVAFTPDDTREWGLPLAGPGLLLEVPREGVWAQRPSLHFEAAPGYRLRVSSGGAPLLWVRIDGYWDRCGFLRGTPSAPWGLPPLSAADVHDFVRAPRAARKLFGYQGLPPVDVAALEDLAARLAWMKDNHPEIALVEFNPVLCGASGAVILAADVRIGNAAQRTDSARRAMLG